MDKCQAMDNIHIYPQIVHMIDCIEVFLSFSHDLMPNIERIQE